MSLFAQHLCELLDHTDLFNRTEWASFLGVEEGAIEDWVWNRAIPTPRQLYTIYNTVKMRGNACSKIVGKFEFVISRPSRSLPFGDCMLPTPAEYMFRPLKDDIDQLKSQTKYPG